MRTQPKKSIDIDLAKLDPACVTGLCASCSFAESHANARGSVFWRCRFPSMDGASGRYPGLPVRECAGFAPLPERGRHESEP